MLFLPPCCIVVSQLIFHIKVAVKWSVLQRCHCCWTRAFMQDLLLFKRRIMCPGWCSCAASSFASCCCCLCCCFLFLSSCQTDTHTKTYSRAVCVCKHQATLLDNVFKWSCVPAPPSPHFTQALLHLHHPCNILFTFFTRRLPWHILLLLLLLLLMHYEKNKKEEFWNFYVWREENIPLAIVSF